MTKMALSPTAATAARDAKRDEQIAQLETAIDQKIEQSFDANQLIYDIASTVKTSVHDEIVNRYRNAGWIVETSTDFNNNRRLLLSAPV